MREEYRAAFAILAQAMKLEQEGRRFYLKAKQAAAGASPADGRDALLFGMDIETRSYDLYRRGAEGTADPLGRQIFAFLADQERSHFNVLMLRYESLFGSSTWYP